jgi:cobalt-zinc-cadmium efflux system outer membrane protein
LNDRSPVEQFDITGLFEFSETRPILNEMCKITLDIRPDLKAAMNAVDKAQTDHKLAMANGSTDPTYGFDFGRNPSIDAYARVSVNIPLRIFDQNQGEKLGSQRDIDRNQRLLDATQAQEFSDFDSTYETLSSNLILRQPHKTKYLPHETKYLPHAVRVRNSLGFSCQNSCASLLDFLDAESEYRTVQISYVNLIGSYLTAASQLNLAVGREVIP